MKRVLPILLVLFLAGCAGSNPQMERALKLRQKLETGDGCRFCCCVTADYGDQLVDFSMECAVGGDGTVFFTVTDPETISGITGSISETGGKLTFDETVLAFETLTEAQLSPIAAPWLLIRTLRSGYLTACGEENGRLRLTVHDSYREKSAVLEIWLNEQDLPARGEVFWEEKRILTVTVDQFAFV